MGKSITTYDGRYRMPRASISSWPRENSRRPVQRLRGLSPFFKARPRNGRVPFEKLQRVLVGELGDKRAFPREPCDAFMSAMLL